MNGPRGDTLTARALPIRDAFADLDELYAKLPRIDCKGLCHEACGPIAMAPSEMERLRAVSDRALRPIDDGDGVVYLLPEPDTLTCPLLSAEKRCTAYAARPMICRLFGLVRKMRCPFGCKPARWLSDDEAVAFLATVHREQRIQR